METSRLFAILIPSLPLLACLVTACIGAFGSKSLKEKSHIPVILACAGSFVCALLLLMNIVGKVNAEPTAGAEMIGYEEIHQLWTWASVPDAYPEGQIPESYSANDSGQAVGQGSREFRIDVALRSDPLTSIMLVMVTFIGTLVAIYASGYMHGDRGYWRFFSYVGIFIFSMTMLVSVSNFLLLFVFWEAVGACSYLLIGFWYEKPSAAAAGKKAFLVNRIGDFGFALAMFLIWKAYGTLNFHDTDAIAGIFGQARLASGAYVAGGMGLAICLLLMLGACGKSAQFPLHVWLPDAMEGPTPVSALIHAATMVTAGVYMVTRCTPLMLASPSAQVTVACIGGGTALLAGLIALTQFDLKRVLAYSTISQLGYMFLGLGTGTVAGIVAGMFHLFTHAFFKALLFLGSGSVMHSMGNVIDMRRFGGLRKLMPITHATFAVGCLALAGLFPFAGFWSKDAIIGAVQDQSVAMESALNNSGQHTPAAHVNSVPDTGIRLVSHEVAMVNSEGDGHGGGHHEVTTAHLSKFTEGELRCGVTVYKWLKYIALFTAFLTAFYTFRAYFMTFFGDLEVPHEAGDHAHEAPPSMWIPLAVLSVFAFAVGFGLELTHAFSSFIVHTPSLANTVAAATPQAGGPMHMDVALTSSVIAVLGIAIAAFMYLGDQSEARSLAKLFDSALIGKPYRLSYGKFFIDEIYNLLIVKPLEGLAGLAYLVDRWIVDGLVNLCGWIPKAAGGVMRGLQMGLVPFYGLAMVLGMLTLLAVRAMWGGG
jgi:NADH-quinone oxidoreductase subunit L